MSLLLLTARLLPAADLPDTGPGQIAREFFSVVNGGKASAVETFVTNRIVEVPANQMTREKYRKMLAALQEESGDLVAERVLMSDAQNLRLLIASAKAGKKAALELVLPAKDASQANWLWLYQMPGANPSPLPKGSMDERAQLAAIEKYLDGGAGAGIHSGAVLLAKQDEVLLNKAWGYADSAAKTPNETRMQYGTASVGKMFTAVAIAQLHQAGKLEYTDTIGQHLPDYPNAEAARKVQIKHLLAHTGGLGDPFESPKLANSKSYKKQSDWFETFADKPLAFAPGDHHEYSNGGFIVLAAIVEKISGQKFSEYVKAHIFDPLDMTHTGLSTASEVLPVSTPHSVKVTEDPLGLKGPQPKQNKGPQDGAGMGGWTSTTEDLFKFARGLRTGKLLDQAHTEEITTGKVQFIPPPMNIKYCYGFYEMPIGRERMVGHSGGGGDLGAGAEVEMLWNSGYTIVVLSNHGLEEARRAAHDIARFLVYQEEHPAGLNSAATR